VKLGKAVAALTFGSHHAGLCTILLANMHAARDERIVPAISLPVLGQDLKSSESI
jgi:hypothetical protein